MKAAGAVLGVMLALFAAQASAEEALGPYRKGAAIERGADQVRKAFFRRQATVEPTQGLRPDAPGALSDLIPQYGFVANTSFLSFSLTALDVHRSRICAKTTVGTPEEWLAAMRAYMKMGYTLSDVDCAVDAGLQAPASFPATVAARTVLDSRDVPARTLLAPTDLTLSGVTAPYALPAFTLTAGAGAWSAPATITVSNPTEQVSAVVSASIREGFEVTHDCAELLPAAACSVSVRYQGKAGERYRVGSLRLTFASGGYAVIGVLGVRQ